MLPLASLTHAGSAKFYSDPDGIAVSVPYDKWVELGRPTDVDLIFVRS